MNSGKPPLEPSQPVFMRKEHLIATNRDLKLWLIKGKVFNLRWKSFSMDLTKVLNSMQLASMRSRVSEEEASFGDIKYIS